MKPKNQKRDLKYGLFNCSICKKEFNNKANLWRHEKVHCPEKEFKCPSCPYECKLKHYLVRHMMVHNGKKPYQCDYCGKEFTASHSLTSHRYIHTNEKPYQCSFCAYACRDNSTLRKHEARHAAIQKVFHCKMCPKKYKSKARLKVHVAEEHLDLDMKRHECTICKGLYKTKATLAHHIKTVHDKSSRVQCEICGHHVSHRGNLRAHMMTHVDARPYKCGFKQCDKRFKDKETVKRHRLIHYPERQLSCEVCARRFTRRIRLQRHMATHTPHVKCVICDYCGVKFYNKNYLSTHIQRKHGDKKQRYECDICQFVTTNKPSIVMHIKHGHGSENDRECRICHTIYKKHMYLKMHYLKTHNIRYKMKKRKKAREPSIEENEDIKIKEELPDLSDVEEATLDNLDLLDIEKEEFIGFPESKEINENISEPQETTDNITESIEVPEIIPEKIPGYPENLCDNRFDNIFSKHIEVKYEDKGKKVQKNVIRGEQEYAKRHLEQLLVKARRRRKVQDLEELRQVYNERIKAVGNRIQDKVKIKYFEYTKNNVNETRTENDISHTNNDSVHENDVEDDVSDETKAGEDNGEHIDEDEDFDVRNKPNRKIHLNSHQCYICFKLFSTKEALINHCKDHFDICNKITLKKCPICNYVTDSTITKHLIKAHDLKIKLPYTKINDKKDNGNGSRYYYKINSHKIDNLEIIPSVKLLNKQAYIKIDKKSQLNKIKTIEKTKLVKKGKEWVVEKHKVDINNDFLLSKVTESDVNVKLTDSYFDRLKNLSLIAKKRGSKILFPCDGCEKICLTLSALKLHSRKHQSNPKPFKKKIWKHKEEKSGNFKKTGKIQKTVNVKSVRIDQKTGKMVRANGNRFSDPKPIVNNHKCEEELKEFYRNNVKGGDIEFWQFLKIFNKMSRENVNDFQTLESRTDFGMHNVNNYAKSNELPLPTPSGNGGNLPLDKKIKKVRNTFTRTIMISKTDHLKRLAIIKRMRDNIYTSIHTDK